MSKVAWITGASSGLGEALALEMARDGWTVAASARRADRLEALAQAAESASGTIHSFPMDVTDRDATLATVQHIEAAYGQIGQVVLNAGAHRPVDPRNLSADDFRALVELNLMGTVHGLEAVLPSMIEHGSGRIAIVASLAGYRGLPTASAYGMTKAGLINMAECLRVELAPHGITVQLVNPGFVRTPATDRNTFPMPFLMEVAPAAKAFYAGLKSDRFEITFPRRFAAMMKLLRALPAPLAFAVTRRMVPGS